MNSSRLRAVVPVAPTPEKALERIAALIQTELQLCACLVKEVGSSVQYDALQTGERIDRDGITAVVDVLRAGEYFKRVTQFQSLQWVHSAIQAVLEGKQAPKLDEGDDR